MADHSHSHSHPAAASGDRSDRAGSRRALRLTLALTTSFTAAEVVGGLLTGSLALLADAGHMLSDDLSLGLALLAVWLADRPPTAKRTFGYKRAEILAALFNGITLVAISIWIFIEAYRRLEDPPEIVGGWMLAVACLGLAVNAVAALILHRGGDKGLNISAALRHVIADLLGSVGVIVAAVVILLTGWVYADPLVSALIGVLIIASSWTILRDSVRILLEASPAGLEVGEVGAAMAAVEGVVEVHDLHVWTITSGFPALAAHVLVGRDTDCHAKRRELERLLHERFGLDHTTLQVDHAEPELLQIESAGDTRATRGAGDDAAFMFADIAGFTALAETHGDARAAVVVEDFCRHVRDLLPRYGGEEVKTIGDAVMLRVPEPAQAVRLGSTSCTTRWRDTATLECGSGSTSGPLERDGDWLGTTINTAARIAAAARSGEILLSASASAAAGRVPGVSFQPRGAESLRNVSEPVEIVEARCDDEAAALIIDPVCRMALDPAQSFVRLEYAGVEYHFCSAGCRDAFLTDPGAHLAKART